MTATPLAGIRVEGRHRRDLGDVAALAKSIEEVGLLQPVVLTPDNRLVAGERRIAAARLLGWTEIPAVVVTNLTDAVLLLRAEAAENVGRLAFRPSEAAAIAAAREELLKPQASERKRQSPGRPAKDGGKTSGKLPEVFPEPSGESAEHADASAKFAEASEPSGEVRDAAAVDTGFSATSLRKVREVRAIAEDEARPEPVREVAREALAEMDRTRKIDGPYRRSIKAAEKAIVEQMEETLDEVLGPDPHGQDLKYLRKYRDACVKASDFFKFDAERLASLVDSDEIELLNHHIRSVTEFRDRIAKARSGLRVVQGGRR